MYEQNATLSLQSLHNTNNHLLLCELRSKLNTVNQRLKEHHMQSLKTRDDGAIGLRVVMSGA